MFQYWLMNEKSSVRKFRSISEVARQFGISVEVLRKWESDFPRYLRPHRSQGATRRYTEEDIARVEMVYRLLRVEGLTVAGAKKKLSERGDKEECVQQVILRLRGLRDELNAIVQEFEKL